MAVLKFIKPPLVTAFSIAMAVFTLLPESVFKVSNFGIELYGDESIILGRVILIGFIALVSIAAYLLFLRKRNSILLDDDECIIEVKYGNILEESNCKRVISFDECFTVHVGDAPEDVKASSICGQYLCSNPDLDIKTLIERSGKTPEPKPSRFGNKACYAPGSIVPKGDELLVAFAKLNEDGRAEFSHRKEYLDCLERLWSEIHKYCDQKDVAIPILGSGLTNFSGGSGKPLNQQELLNMIIRSYKLSANKIKRPQKLRIVCKRQEGFSLNKISC